MYTPDERSEPHSGHSAGWAGTRPAPTTMIDVSIQNSSPELFQKLEAAVARVVKTVADEAAQKARAMMKGAPRPSLPGGPPAVRTGRYLASIEVINTSTLEARIGAGVPYAPVLEYGMDRPMWGPILAETLPTLEQRLTDELSRI